MVIANRVRIKLQYKNAIKEAAPALTWLSMTDKLYDCLCQKDTVGFWKLWRIILNLRCVLNGKFGDNNVRHEFTEHFKIIFTMNSMSIENSYKKM